MSFNIPVEMKYNFTFEEVLTHERFYASEVGTSLRDASLRALKKLVASNPKMYYTLRGVDYPRRDPVWDKYEDQMNAAQDISLDMYRQMQNSHRRY